MTRTWILLPLLATLTLLTAWTLAPTAVRADEEAPAAEEKKDAYVPKALGPSWRDLGEAAYRDEEYADAVYHYRKWLEADPRDDTTWYNLACCYALDGHLERAIDAFEAAVDAGWTDTEHPLRDPDLEKVRADARFVAALERAKDAKSKDGPADFERHWVKIPAMTTYVAMLPPDYETKPDRAYPLVVILHGNGSSEMGHGRVADRAGRDGVIWIAPRAPYPHHGVFTGMRRPGWTWVPQDSNEGTIDHLDPGQLYMSSILAAVEDARKRYRVSGERFYVFGHSMGGFSANTMAALHPDKLAAYFAYAGGLPDPYHEEAFLKKIAEHGVKAWHVHGRADPVVPPTLSEQAHEKMKAAGIDSTLHMVDDVDHGIRPPVNDLLQAWLKDVVGVGAKPRPKEGDGR